MAQQCNVINQFMNTLAIFGASYYYDTPSPVFYQCIVDNVSVEGLPVHNALPARVLNHSIAYQMTTKARKLLFDLFGKEQAYVVEAILAATIIHSTDHYYYDKFCCFVGKSTVLDADFESPRVNVYSPNRFHYGRFLCRERLDDRVCRLLYTCASEFDCSFADNALFWAVAS